ncbi:hypothetical protein [Luteimonas cucumeris]|nr:hypothetical protein [Luteimonas cucumeris]
MASAASSRSLMRWLLAAAIGLLIATTAVATERGLLVEVRPAPADSLWWTHLDFVPRDTQVRSIAVNRLDPSWCKASELTEAAFPDSVRHGERGLDAYLAGGQNGFSAKGSFDGRPLEIVLGIFESCGGESGNFLLVLAAGWPASSPDRIVQVERISARPVLMYLSVDPARGAIYMPELLPVRPREQVAMECESGQVRGAAGTCVRRYARRG